MKNFSIKFHPFEFFKIFFLYLLALKYNSLYDSVNVIRANKIGSISSFFKECQNWSKRGFNPQKHLHKQSAEAVFADWILAESQFCQTIDETRHSTKTFHYVESISSKKIKHAAVNQVMSSVFHHINFF